MQSGCRWAVPRGHQRRRAEWGHASVAIAVASACGGKTSRPLHRTMAWGRVAGEWRVGSWGCGAHLDRGDLRYQRKQARVVRHAGLAVVIAGAVGEHACGHLWLSALVQAVEADPVGNAVQVPPVERPVGAVLGVVLGPIGVRGHAEPAGVAVPALPSVGGCNTILLISEHAAAEDTDSVTVVPFPYDR